MQHTDAVANWLGVPVYLGWPFDTRFAHTFEKEARTDMMKLAQLIRNFHREESGQDMLEYAMVLAAVLAAVVAGSTTLSNTIATELTAITSAITTLKIP